MCTFHGTKPERKPPSFSSQLVTSSRHKKVLQATPWVVLHHKTKRYHIPSSQTDVQDAPDAQAFAGPPGIPCRPRIRHALCITRREFLSYQRRFRHTRFSILCCQRPLSAKTTGASMILNHSASCHVDPEIKDKTIPNQAR